MNNDCGLLPDSTPERLVIPVTFDMMAAARLLRRRLPHEQYNRLFEAIVQLASDDLEVDSYLVESEPERAEGSE